MRLLLYMMDGKSLLRLASYLLSGSYSDELDCWKLHRDLKHVIEWNAAVCDL